MFYLLRRHHKYIQVEKECNKRNLRKELKPELVSTGNPFEEISLIAAMTSQFFIQIADKAFHFWSSC
jgi:hypothetical protein